MLPNLQDKSMLELVFAPCSPIAGGGVNWNLDFMTGETADCTVPFELLIEDMMRESSQNGSTKYQFGWTSQICKD